MCKIPTHLAFAFDSYHCHSDNYNCICTKSFNLVYRSTKCPRCLTHLSFALVWNHSHSDRFNCVNTASFVWYIVLLNVQNYLTY